MSNAIVPLDRIAWAQLDVDESLMHPTEGPVVESAHKALAEKLRDIGETMAEDLNLDCVNVVERRSPTGPAGPTRTFVARWMPKPGSAAELLGGANDGRQVRVRLADDDIPERVLRMPVEQPLPAFTAPSEPRPTFSNAETYVLVGFRNDSARWVYRAE